MMTALRACTRTKAPMATICAGMLALAAVTAAQAQQQARDWPTRPVRLILPLAPGSGADIGARLIAERLAKTWAQPVAVENRPGGDSIVAINAVIGANDDHMLLWGPSAAFTAHPYTHAKIPYDIRELLPIVRVSNTLVSLSVANAVNATTVAELVSIAKAAPGKLNWASVTGLNDLLFQAFVKEAGIDMVRVPYRDAVQAATDLAEGRIQAYSSPYAISRPQIESGRIRPIAFTNTRRAAIMSNIPTVREAGYPVMEFDGMVGVYGTRSLEDAVRRRISADVRASLTDAVVVDRLAATGQVVNPGDTPEFLAAIEAQRRVAASAARILGIRPAD